MTVWFKRRRASASLFEPVPRQQRQRITLEWPASYFWSLDHLLSSVRVLVWCSAAPVSSLWFFLPMKCAYTLALIHFQIPDVSEIRTLAERGNRPVTGKNKPWLSCCRMYYIFYLDPYLELRQHEPCSHIDNLLCWLYKWESLWNSVSSDLHIRAISAVRLAYVSIQVLWHLSSLIAL